MMRVSQELRGREVREVALLRHFVIAQIVLAPQALTQEHFGNDQQYVQHQLTFGVRRERRQGPTWRFQMQHLNQVRPNQH